MPPTPQPPRIKPPALQPGDTVGIVAPASNIQRESLQAGCATLRRLGYKPFYSDSIFAQDLYFAGSVERRARELEEMFDRDDVRALLCARGGDGVDLFFCFLAFQRKSFPTTNFLGFRVSTTS